MVFCMYKTDLLRYLVMPPKIQRQMPPFNHVNLIDLFSTPYSQSALGRKTTSYPSSSDISRTSLKEIEPLESLCERLLSDISLPYFCFILFAYCLYVISRQIKSVLIRSLIFLELSICPSNTNITCKLLYIDN